MKTFVVVSLILGVLFLTVFGGTVVAADNNEPPITIGVLENRGFAFAGMMRGSFDLAMDMINAKGGINGRPIQLAFADDRGEKQAGIKAVKQLVQEQKAVILVGGYSSSNTIYMAQTAESLDIPLLVCTAADDRITQRAMQNVYRLNPPSNEYASGLEELLLLEVKPASMAIIYENSPFGTSGAMRMMWFCRDNDIEITAITPYHKERVAAEYFQHLIEPLKHNQPQVIYMVSYMQDGVQLVKQIRRAKIDSLLCGGAGGFTHPDFIKMTGEASQHFLTATLWCADQRHALAGEYEALYGAKYKQAPDYHGAEAYSALMVAVDALKRSRTVAARDIREALDQTNLQTPFGPVQFFNYGKYERQNRRPTLVLQNLENKYGCVWPKELAVARFELPSR